MNIMQKKLNASVNVAHPVFIEAQYLLSNAPWIVKVLTRPFINPYYFRFSADFTLTLNTPDESKSESGKGIFEMMLLRGLQTVR